MSFIRNKIRFSKVGVALGLAAIKSRRCAGRTEARQCENVALGFRSGQENLRFLASFWCCTNATVKVQSRTSEPGGPPHTALPPGPEPGRAAGLDLLRWHALQGAGRPPVVVVGG